MSKRTKNALLARGVDSELANQLTCRGYTVKGLSGMSQSELIGLDLSQETIYYLYKERPPISKETVIRLLYQLRSTCCVCRGTKGTSFIIHHIVPWAISHSHNIENLILLCPVCHDHAHTKRELTQNFDKETLLSLKAEWMKFINEEDKRIVKLRKRDQEHSGFKTWDYFNHNRILEFSLHRDLPDYSTFFESGQDKQYVYSGRMRTTTTYDEFIKLLGNILDVGKYVIIDNHTPIGDLSVLMQPDVIIVLTANLRFRTDRKWDAVGPNQIRHGYYKRKRIEIKFIFDGWECTSTSAYGHLSGRWTCTSILWVRNVHKSSNNIIVDTTCLAIGTNVFPYHSETPAFVAKREYEEYLKECGEDLVNCE